MAQTQTTELPERRFCALHDTHKEHIDELWVAVHQKVDTAMCIVKHQEVSEMRKMLWGVIILNLTILGGVIAALLKTTGAH